MEKINTNRLRDITKINAISERDSYHTVQVETNRFIITMKMACYFCEKHIQFGRICEMDIVRITNRNEAYTFKQGKWGKSTPEEVRNLATKLNQAFSDLRY